MDIIWRGLQSSDVKTRAITIDNLLKTLQHKSGLRELQHYDARLKLMNSAVSTVKDANPKIAATGLECTKILILKCPEDFSPLVNMSFELLLSKFADTKTHLRSKACEVLLALARLAGLSPTIERLTGGLSSSKNQRAKESILTSIMHLMELHSEHERDTTTNTNRITVVQMQALSTVVSAQLNDPQTSVRTLSIETLGKLVAVYSDAVMDVVSKNEIVKPAQLQSIKDAAQSYKFTHIQQRRNQFSLDGAHHEQQQHEYGLTTVDAGCRARPASISNTKPRKSLSETIGSSHRTLPLQASSEMDSTGTAQIQLKRHFSSGDSSSSSSSSGHDNDHSSDGIGCTVINNSIDVAAMEAAGHFGCGAGASATTATRAPTRRRSVSAAALHRRPSLGSAGDAVPQEPLSRQSTSGGGGGGGNSSTLTSAIMSNNRSVSRQHTRQTDRTDGGMYTAGEGFSSDATSTSTSTSRSYRSGFSSTVNLSVSNRNGSFRSQQSQGHTPSLVSGASGSGMQQYSSNFCPEAFMPFIYGNNECDNTAAATISGAGGTKRNKGNIQGVRIVVRDVLELNRIMRGVTTNLNKKDDWDARLKALIQLQALGRGVALSEAPLPLLKSIQESLRSIHELISAQIMDLRSVISKEACRAVATLATSLKQQFSPLVDLWLPHLMRLVVVKIQVVSSAADRCIRVIIASCVDSRLLSVVLDTCQGKNPPLRKLACEYLALVCAIWRVEVIEKNIDKIKAALKSGVSDADPGARRVSRILFWVLHARSAALRVYMDKLLASGGEFDTGSTVRHISAELDAQSDELLDLLHLSEHPESLHWQYSPEAGQQENTPYDDATKDVECPDFPEGEDDRRANRAIQAAGESCSVLSELTAGIGVPFIEAGRQSQHPGTDATNATNATNSVLDEYCSADLHVQGEDVYSTDASSVREDTTAITDEWNSEVAQGFDESITTGTAVSEQQVASGQWLREPYSTIDNDTSNSNTSQSFASIPTDYKSTIPAVAADTAESSLSEILHIADDERFAPNMSHSNKHQQLGAPRRLSMTGPVRRSQKGNFVSSKVSAGCSSENTGMGERTSSAPSSDALLNRTHSSLQRLPNNTNDATDATDGKDAAAIASKALSNGPRRIIRKNDNPPSTKTNTISSSSSSNSNIERSGNDNRNARTSNPFGAAKANITRAAAATASIKENTVRSDDRMAAGVLQTNKDAHKTTDTQDPPTAVFVFSGEKLRQLVQDTHWESKFKAFEYINLRLNRAISSEETLNLTILETFVDLSLSCVCDTHQKVAVEALHVLSHCFETASFATTIAESRIAAVVLALFGRLADRRAVVRDTSNKILNSTRVNVDPAIIMAALSPRMSEVPDRMKTALMQYLGAIAPHCDIFFSYPQNSWAFLCRMASILEGADGTGSSNGGGGGGGSSSNASKPSVTLTVTGRRLLELVYKTAPDTICAQMAVLPMQQQYTLKKLLEPSVPNIDSRILLASKSEWPNKSPSASKTAIATTSTLNATGLGAAGDFVKASGGDVDTIEDGCVQENSKRSICHTSTEDHSQQLQSQGQVEQSGKSSQSISSSSSSSSTHHHNRNSRGTHHNTVTTALVVQSAVVRTAVVQSAADFILSTSTPPATPYQTSGTTIASMHASSTVSPPLPSPPPAAGAGAAGAGACSPSPAKYSSTNTVSDATPIANTSADYNVSSGSHSSRDKYSAAKSQLLDAYSKSSHAVANPISAEYTTMSTSPPIAVAVGSGGGSSGGTNGNIDPRNVNRSPSENISPNRSSQQATPLSATTTNNNAHSSYQHLNQHNSPIPQQQSLLITEAASTTTTAAVCAAAAVHPSSVAIKQPAAKALLEVASNPQPPPPPGDIAWILNAIRPGADISQRIAATKELKALIKQAEDPYWLQNCAQVVSVLLESFSIEANSPSGMQPSPLAHQESSNGSIPSLVTRQFFNESNVSRNSSSSSAAQQVLPKILLDGDLAGFDAMVLSVKSLQLLMRYRGRHMKNLLEIIVSKLLHSIGFAPMALMQTFEQTLSGFARYSAARLLELLFPYCDTATTTAARLQAVQASSESSSDAVLVSPQSQTQQQQQQGAGNRSNNSSNPAAKAVLLAMRVITSSVRFLTSAEVLQALPALSSAVLPALVSKHVDHRQAAIFALVECYLVVGEALFPFLSEMTVPQRKLLTIYIEKKMQQRATAATGTACTSTGTDNKGVEANGGITKHRRHQL